MDRLMEIVPTYTVQSRWDPVRQVMTMEYIKWSAVAVSMNRPPADCRYMWDKQYQKVPYTAEEDELIIQRVAEWSDKGKVKGLWVGLRQALGRPESAIRNRYFNKLRVEAPPVNLSEG